MLRFVFVKERAHAFALARIHGVASQDADDIAQDVILALIEGRVRTWQHRPPGGAARARLLAGLVRHVLARRRGEHRPAEQGEATTAPSVEDLALGAERTALVHEALATLERQAPDLAAALYHRVYEGRSVKRSRLRRAHIALATIFQRYT